MFLYFDTILTVSESKPEKEQEDEKFFDINIPISIEDCNFIPNDYTSILTGKNFQTQGNPKKFNQLKAVFDNYKNMLLPLTINQL